MSTLKNYDNSSNSNNSNTKNASDKSSYDISAIVSLKMVLIHDPIKHRFKLVITCRHSSLAFLVMKSCRHLSLAFLVMNNQINPRFKLQHSSALIAGIFSDE